MSSSIFLVVDEQPLTLEQALNYLQTAGKFQPFLLEIINQYVINQELKARPGLQLSPEVLEQVLIDFRVKRELTDPQAFQAWLDSNGVSYETFRQQYIWDLTCERLKIWLSQSRLQNYFDQRKPFLDQVILSWVATNTKEQADALRHQIEAGTTIEQLSYEKSAIQTLEVSDQERSHPLLDLWKRFTEVVPDSNNALEVAIKESFSLAEMPEGLREAINPTQPGGLIGPLLINDDWYVLQVDEFLPAELDEALEAQLRDEIFAEWLNERVSAISVKLDTHERLPVAPA